jgi:colanic acid/amylovoran biosynthesis glycosyltransferase
MKVAFITWKFPCLPNTFILNEVIAVIKLGHDVSIFSIVKSDEVITNPDLEKYRLPEKTFYFEDFITPGSMLTQSIYAKIQKITSNRYLNIFEVYKHDDLLNEYYALSQVTKKIRKEKFDIIHGCFGANSATVAMVVSRVTGIPFTFECTALKLLLFPITIKSICSSIMDFQMKEL